MQVNNWLASQGLRSQSSVYSFEIYYVKHICGEKINISRKRKIENKILKPLESHKRVLYPILDRSSCLLSVKENYPLGSS